MISAPKLAAVAALSLTLLAGCAYVPGDPVEVPPVSGDVAHPPAPVQAPATAGASVSGSWTGYWTWDNSRGAWYWTWVWNAASRSQSTS
jgi:hypothetical protein